MLTRAIGGRLILLVAAFAAFSWLSGSASGEPSTSAREPATATNAIRFGMVTALSGPAANLGIHMRAGVLAAFEEVNRSGGVHGRKIELMARDDGYEPSRTGPAVRELIEKERVLAFVGNVGTPTGVITLPICRETGTLFVGPFTGAMSLRTQPGQPVDPVAFHYRASYHEETGAMVDALLDEGGLKPEEIAVFSQRDAYGDAGYSGTVAALQRRGGPEQKKPLHARYERNTVAVESAVADCLSSPVRPRAIIMVGAYAPCAAFIKTCIESDFHPLFLNVSFVGPESLAKELGPIGDGTIVTQVVPTLDSEAAAIKTMSDSVAALPPGIRVEPSLGALEGYMVGKMVVSALAAIPPDEPPTSKALATALEALGAFDPGIGQKLSLSGHDHQASHRVWPSIVRNGRITSMNWSDLKETLGRNTAHVDTEDTLHRP